MLEFFRTLTRSRIGAAIGVLFLILIALAFSSGGVSSFGSGGLHGGDNVAQIGGSRITTSDLEKTLRASFDGERQRTPTLTMKDFLAQGAIDQVLTGLIDSDATWEWGHKNGIGVSDRLIDSEIAKLPAFQGADGKFSQDAYKAFLQQRGLTDSLVRDDIGKGLMSKLVLSGAVEGAVMPTGVTQIYAAVIKERRTGNLVFLPAEVFAPKTPPTDQQIGQFYKTNVARYNRPERRTVRYAVIDDAALKTFAPPGDGDIRKRYQANAATYAPGEIRSITQVILPTEPAAKAFAAELATGKTIAAAAGAKGLVPAKIADRTHDQIAADNGKAVADAVFATAQGKITTPAKGTLGWVVAQVDAITRKTGKTFEQARPEILAALTAERRKAALIELATQIGEKVERGTSLGDVAKAYGLAIVTTDAVQADGKVPGKPDAALSADVQPLLQSVFAMEHEGQPQIAALPGGARFAVYDVGQIVPAAPAALPEIKSQVAADWMRQQGADAAAGAADKLLAALAKKTPVGDAAMSLGVALPPVRPVSFTRQDLAQMGNRVPPPLALLFTMKAGSARKLALNGQAGWAVVTLDTIEPGTIAANDPLLAQAANELGKATARDYQDQLRNAITREIGARRNATALATVRTSLSGGQ